MAKYIPIYIEKDYGYIDGKGLIGGWEGIDGKGVKMKAGGIAPIIGREGFWD